MASKNKRFADDGWAIWITGDDTSTVYINDWLNPQGRSYVDLAVRIRGVRVSHALYIYIPFQVTAQEVEDPSLQFQNEGVLRATFSAACIIDFMKDEYTSEIAYNGRTIELVHISKSGFSLKDIASGTLLSVDLDALHPYLENDEAYFILRLPHKSLDQVFKPRINVSSTFRRLQDLLMSPIVSDKYGYSIRINEARLLPSEINRIGSFHRQKLKKAVITISIDEDYSLNDGNCYRIRRVEEALYRDYVPQGFDCGEAITYQWNQSRENNLLGQFNFYFDLSRDTISKLSVLLYLVLLLLVGMVGDLLWTLIGMAVPFLS